MRLKEATGTVRFRITALAVGAVALVLVVAGAALVIAQRRVLLQGLDSTLVTRGRSIVTMFDSGTPDLSGVDDDRFVQITDDEGFPLVASPNIGDFALETPQAAGPTIWEVSDLPFEDEPFRVLSIPAGTHTVHVGEALGDIDDSVAALLTALLVGGPALLVTLGLIVWWLVGRTLRPVDRIRSEVLAIQADDDLHRRVPQPEADDEIGRLAQSMNQMLDRLEKAATRQREFVGDVSHELRSPLTRIRSELEVDLAHPRTADPEQTRHSVLEETIALQALIDDLLVLIQTDTDERPLDTKVDVARVAAEEAELCSRAVELDLEEAFVIGDSNHLARLVGNLLDNAVHHAAGTIRMATRSKLDTVTLTVEDDGPGVPSSERERVFDRFTRLDEARTTDAGGAGLGLAIVRAIAQCHQGTVQIEESRPGARFVVELAQA